MSYAIEKGYEQLPTSWATARHRTAKLAAVPVVFVAIVILLTLPIVYVHYDSKEDVIAQCVIIQPTGFNSGGFGDFLKLSVRCEVAAQVLGCSCMRPIVRSSVNYTTSELLSGASTRIDLRASRTCLLESVLDINELEASDPSCTLELIGDPSKCDIYTYDPTQLLYDTSKLPCVAERMRKAMMPLPPPTVRNCPDGYVAIHKRWGDLSEDVNDFRHTTAREIQLAVKHVQVLHPHWSKECFVVFAEAYPHAQIEGVDAPHVVDTNPELKQIMSDMVHAQVLLVGASGLMTPVAMLFKGSELLVRESMSYRYEGILRAGVALTALEVDGAEDQDIVRLV